MGKIGLPGRQIPATVDEVSVGLVEEMSYALGFPPIGASPIPNFWGMLIATVCLLQLFTGVILDRSYDRLLKKYFIVAVFYPLVYWILMAVITVITAPLGWNVNHQKRKFTLWKPVRE